jgi:phosphoesterase RecJ-like protein
VSVDLTPFAEAVPTAVVEAVGGARAALIATHENPDADTIGAALAVGILVEARGGRATLVCSDPIPDLYDFLPGVERFRTDPEPGAAYDLLVVCDCGTLDRIGAIRGRHRALFDGLPRVVVDHHVSNDGSGPTDWIDAGSAATCEMLALLAGRLDVPLDAADGALATALMAGIVMDTATFAHPNATPRTLAAALVEAGAPLATSRAAHRTKPDAQLRLFGRVLDRLETSGDGRVNWSTLLEADLVATGSDAAHSEGLIDLLAQSERAEVSILFKETGGATRISVRTKAGGVDATELTGRFGGGGHARAAGATVPRPIADARPIVVTEAERLAARVTRRVP